MINSFIEKMKALYLKHKSIILYVFFGAITTIVNYVTYYTFQFIFTNIFILPTNFITGASNTVAWVISVLVAFVPNKFLVFESKSTEKNKLLSELFSFFGARALSFFVDFGIVVVFVDYFKMNDFLIKTISNVFVLIFNYIASKYFIFKNKNK